MAEARTECGIWTLSRTASSASRMTMTQGLLCSSFVRHAEKHALTREFTMTVLDEIAVLIDPRYELAAQTDREGNFHEV